MPIPEHVATFIQINTAGRVYLLCRSLGVQEPFRIDYYTRALREAVMALADDPALEVMALDRILNEQLDLLAEALKKAPAAPSPRIPEKSIEPQPVPAAGPVPEPRQRRRRGPEPVKTLEDGASMENLLEEARKPLRKLLQEDCVRLSLLDPEQARKLSARMAGRSPEDAEAEVVTELRNSLHRQVRTYLKKYKGGPWDSPRLQEELRLDIANVNSVQGMVNLTRRILQECREWEASGRKGLFHSILGGRAKVSGAKK